MKTVTLPDGTEVPKAGQGTWYLGENPGKRSREIEALRLGVRIGMNLIDTAEMYGDGASEELVGEAIRPLERSGLFLTSKVYPWNAGREHIFSSCRSSLKRLGTEYLDLYLLHWRGSVPLRETVACMEELKARGMIRRWGVSNFDLDDMKELLRVPKGENCAVVQDLYHLGSRGVEYDLLPFLRQQGIPLMAYSPLAQAGGLRQALLKSAAVQTVAERHDCTRLQILLAFVLHQENVFAIPRAGQAAHVQANCDAAKIDLTREECGLLDREFPAPRHKVGLDMI